MAVGRGYGVGVSGAAKDSHNGVRATHAAEMMTVMVLDIVLAKDEIRALCVAGAGDLHEVHGMMFSGRG